MNPRNLEGRLPGGFLGTARVESEDRRFLTILGATVSRIPSDVAPLGTLRSVSYEERGDLPGLVGLTTWRQVGAPWDRQQSGGTQTIEIYRELFVELSEEAAGAVVAHELAHAWLNEHVRPEDSRAREAEADRLASDWGFGEELRALSEETESVWEPPESRHVLR